MTFADEGLAALEVERRFKSVLWCHCEVEMWKYTVAPWPWKNSLISGAYGGLCRHMVERDLLALAGGLYGEGYSRPFIRVAEALFFIQSWSKGDTPELCLFKTNPGGFAALVKMAYCPPCRHHTTVCEHR